ncbi:MAG TPA: hypothetical protein VH000_02875, partial [Rhizomicrobium sp.]|nr:hypothetical protein [Rhizomicrobium sp.]
DMASAITVGQVWQLMHLAAATVNLSAQPMNQPMECVDRAQMLNRPDVFKAAVAKFAKLPDWEPTFIFRMGNAEHPALPSPRRPLEDVIRA